MQSFVIYCALCLFCLTAGVSAETKAEKNFKKLAAEILNNLQEYWPVHATDMGVHEFDSRFTDYSPGAVNKQRKNLRKYLARLEKYKGVRLPEDMKINRKLLVSNCQIANMKLWEKKFHTKNPNIYLNDAADGLYFILIRDYAPLESRLDDIIGRMNALPEFLAQGRAGLLDPPPLWLDHARENVLNVIDLYWSVGEEMQNRFPARVAQIKPAADRALGALNQFKTFLETLTPGEVGSFAIGKEYFDFILTHQHFFDFDSDSLLGIGETLLAEATEDYDETKTKLAEAGYLDTLDLFIPTSISRQDVLDYYTWEVEAVRQFVVDHDMITIPEDIGDCLIKETPEYLLGVIGGIAYQPAGPFDEAATGYFYVRPIPDSLPDDVREKYFRSLTGRDFRGAVVHEAYPGHHLQMQLAGRLASDVRRWQMNNCLIEGWALYCEEMVHRLGLYKDDPARYLRILRGVQFRAARIVVDVKLHTGQFNYPQAVTWMAEIMGIDTAIIKTEVLRYSTDAGQPMSYLMGKRQIIELRDKVKAREGEAFDPKSFHDRLLAEGSIPVSLIARKMLR